MKTMGLFLGMIAAVGLILLVVYQPGQINQAGELAARQIEAQAEIARAKADQSGFEMAREINRDSWAGQRDLIYANATTHEMVENGETLRYLATHRQKTIDSWVFFVQALVLICAGAGVFAATIVLGQLVRR